MAFQTWQVGLDIQNTQLYALAIQRRRNGWQLCHWWQQSLPQDTLRNGVLQSSPELLAALTCLRKQLPVRYSLRVGIPSPLALQRMLALPEQPLQEPALARYVTAAARRLFPIEPDSLALDYRTDAASHQLQVTAARKMVVEQWLTPLRQAGLQPEVLELNTQALASVAISAHLKDDEALLLQQDAQWLWYCHGSEHRMGVASHTLSSEAIQQQYFPQAATVYCCTPYPWVFTASQRHFSPFSLFLYQHPPLPEQSAAFCLACGLALRPEDRE